MEVVAASVDITPSRLLPTACHGPLNTPSERVALPFEANMAAFRENGRILVIVSLDWFFASPGLRACILERCEGRLDEKSLFVAASHTHTSPATDQTKIGYSAVDKAYVASAEHAIANTVDKILRSRDWRPARLRFTTTACDCAIHRRRRIWQFNGRRIRHKVARYPNPQGPRDRELRLLRVEDEAGQLLSLIWGVSCHPTEWPRIRELSSDYPGVIRGALRAEVGPNLPVLFLQGFCGDLRPPAIGRWKRRGPWIKRLLLLANTLVNGPCFSEFSPEQHHGWQSGMVECASRAVHDAANTPPLATKLALHRSSIALSDLGLSGETSVLTCHWFDLAEQLRVIGISAEPCWEYAYLMKRAFPAQAIWPVGYIDSVFGYLPTQAMLREGGYEVTGFRKAFGIKGEFVGNLEEVIEGLVSS
jgi:neutral ceramidase